MALYIYNHFDITPTLFAYYLTCHPTALLYVLVSVLANLIRPKHENISFKCNHNPSLVWPHPVPAPLCTVRDQSQPVFCHECCYHNFSRLLRGADQLRNHKQLLCQYSQTN